MVAKRVTLTLRTHPGICTVHSLRLDSGSWDQWPTRTFEFMHSCIHASQSPDSAITDSGLCIQQHARGNFINEDQRKHTFVISELIRLTPQPKLGSHAPFIPQLRQLTSVTATSIVLYACILYHFKAPFSKSSQLQII